MGIGCSSVRQPDQDETNCIKKHDPFTVQKIYDNNTVKKPLVADSKEPPKPSIVPTTTTTATKLLRFPTPPILTPMPRITSIDEDKPINIQNIKQSRNKNAETVNFGHNTDNNPQQRLHLRHQSAPLPSISSMSRALIVKPPSDITLISKTQTMQIPHIQHGGILSELFYPISRIKSAPKDTPTPSYNTDNKEAEISYESAMDVGHESAMDKDNLLVYGYVRSIAMAYKQHYGMNANAAILPPENAMQIFEILFAYFSTLNMLFCLDESIETMVYIADMNDMETCFKCSVRDINDINVAVRYVSDVDNVGLSHCNGIKLPDCINNLLYKYDKRYNPTQNSILFKCGSKSTQFGLTKQFECCALIINEEQLQDRDNGNVAYFWELPAAGLPIVDFNDVIYSSQHKCLLCVGGSDVLGNVTADFWRLSFDFERENMDHWKWFKMPDMAMGRALPSCLMVNDYLCVCGGYRVDNNIGKDILLDSVEIFDFNSFHFTWKGKEIKNMNYARCAAGCYFQHSLQKIFIGGGSIENSESNRIEYCDLYKNEWYDLCDTNMEHKHYPSIWIENNYLLNIASVTSDGMECIDLRENTNKWKILYSQNSCTLSQLFDLNPCPFTFMDITDVNQYKYRLIK